MQAEKRYAFTLMGSVRALSRNCWGVMRTGSFMSSGRLQLRNSRRKYSGSRWGTSKGLCRRPLRSK